MKISHVIQTSLIIRAALIMGTIAIGAILTFLSLQDPEEAAIDWMFVGIGGVMFVGTVFASFIVPSLACSQAANVMDEEIARKLRHGEEIEEVPATMNELLRTWQTSKIVQGAALEGGAVVNIVLSLISNHPFNLAFALAAVILMAITFPSKGSLRGFLERKCASHA